MTPGLTAVQAEIFLLSREIQTLRGKLALDFIQMSHTEANFRMGPRQPAMNIRFRSVLPGAGTAWPHSAWVRPGCTSILYSSVMPSIINSSWYSSSIGARRLSRLYMIVFGKWSVGLWKVQANLQRMV